MSYRMKTYFTNIINQNLKKLCLILEKEILLRYFEASSNGLILAYLQLAYLVLFMPAGTGLSISYWKRHLI